VSSKFDKLDSDDVIHNYYKLKSAQKVADTFNVSEPTILKILKLKCVKLNGNAKRNHQIDAAINEYNSGTILNKVIKAYGFSKKYFIKILRERNIPIIDLNTSIILDDRYLHLYNNAVDAFRIYNQRNVVQDVACKYNLTAAAVRSVFNYAGYKIDSKRQNSAAALDTKGDEIINEYKACLLVSPVAKKFKISAPTLTKFLKSHGICLLNKRQAIQKNNNTYEHQRKCFTQSHRSKKYTLPSGKVIHVQGYEDNFLNYVFNNNILQEEDFDFQNIPRFKYADVKHYYPDFYIPKHNIIVEIKSEYTLQQSDKRKYASIDIEKYKFIIIVDKEYQEFDKLINDIKGSRS
jgi:hypothetical protein